MKWSHFALFMLTGMIWSTCVLGQFYTTGESPASLKWSYIYSPHFNIVFPSGLNDEANELANKLEYYLPFSREDLNYKTKNKFPILLHSTSVLSNGYVTLAPGRMELVTTPPQDSYAQNWLTQLTLHEYRHVAQLGSMNSGFTRILGWLTGEIASGSVSSQIPSWFYEGDAVFNETNLSESGRGRVAGFEMPVRTLLIEKDRPFSYDKAIFGSYRDFVPDHYRYGYQIVGFARSKYGKNIWSQAIRYTSGHPFLVWPLAFYLKKNYGFYKNGLYKQALDSLKQQYNKQKDSITYTDYASKNKRINSTFVNYILPKDMGNGKTLALRTGLNDPGTYIVIDSTGKIEKLFTTGASMALKNDLYGNLLIWDEHVSDPRWERRDYSEIRKIDLRTGRPVSLTRKTRYFSPDFSPDGSRIVVAETDGQNRHFLTILDAQTGDRLRQIPSRENRAIQFPEWISEKEVGIITVSDKGKQIEVFSFESNSWDVKFPYTNVDIAELINYKNYILFRGSFNGIENVYAVSKNNFHGLYQVTFSRYGAYHPALSINKRNLLFSDYGPDGFDVVSVPLDTAGWKFVLPDKGPQPRWTDPVPGIKRQSLSRDSIPGIKYAVKPYRKQNHLVNIHSWLPFYTDWEDVADNVADLPIYPGFTLFSQNLLGSVISSVGYRYVNGYHEIIPSVSWRGWYPVIELTGRFGGPSQAMPLPEGIEPPDNTIRFHEINLRTYIPLTYNRGNFVTFLQPSVEYEHAGIWYHSNGELHKGIDFLHYRLILNHYNRLSKRDLYPRWGQFISATYTQTPIEKGQFGNLFSTQAVTYIPGIFQHHHFFLRGGIQIQRPARYYMPVNRVSFPRGYNSAVSEKIVSVMLNYSFPVAYPDLSIGPLLYLKRIRVNLFHDWSYGKEIKENTSGENVDFTGNYRSLGTEILADMHLIRIIFPITAGVRLGYIPDRQSIFSEILLSIDTGIF